MSRGLIIGKFYPLHRGHEYLIENARTRVDELTVVVCSLPSETIPAEVRLGWVRERFDDVRVLQLTDELPQHPDEDPLFWEKWESALREILAENSAPIPDVVFGSESYIPRLASCFDARAEIVDLDRAAVPIRATDIRNDPWRFSHFLSENVRAYFVKTVVVAGPESTGKTTLCERLAEHFGGLSVPEFARAYLEARDGVVGLSDMGAIASGQANAIDIARSVGKRLVFADTDARATRTWSQFLFGEVPNEVHEFAERSDADLYLLCDVDVPYVDDTVRYLGPDDQERERFFRACREELNGRNVVLVSGDWEERFSKAKAAVATLG